MRRAFINAHFYQNDAPAVLVDDGQFVRFGTNEEIEHIAGFDEVIDLCGMYVYPGFVDSHMHLAELGMYSSQLQLKDCGSLDAIAQKTKKKTAGMKEGEWIIARGWDEHLQNGIPDRQFLDEVCGNHPAAFMRTDGHMMSVNTIALEKAGIHEDLSSDGGHIDFARGLVSENAMNLITAVQPQPDEDTIQKYILAGAETAGSYGITTVGSDDFLSIVRDWRPVLNVYEKLSYQEVLPVRVNEQCEFTSPEELAAFLDEGYTFAMGSDLFRIGPLKLIIDGSLGAHTALLTRPYLNESDNQGMLIMDEDTIETFIKLAHHFNMPVIAHAIGDGAVDIMLDLFQENTFEAYGSNPLHDGLVHCQILRRDQIERIQKYQLSCYFQSLFIEEDARLIKQVDPYLQKESYPFKTLFETTLASNGSDAPVEMPDVLKGMIYAETRRSSSGEPLNLDQALTRQQAFESYTSRGYEQLFMDHTAGQFKEGYYADFTVIDTDILNCSIDELKKAGIIMTVMNGNTVYEK